MGTYNDLRKAKRIWIWGMGELSKHYLHDLEPSLPVAGICDSDPSKEGKTFDLRGNRLTCRTPDEIQAGDGVMIAVRKKTAAEEIGKILDGKRAVWCHLFDAVGAYYDSLGEKLLSEEKNAVAGKDEKDRKIVKFIDCFVPIDRCNLRCPYCYLKQDEKFQNKFAVYPDAKVIRKALSKERMGGTVFINFCGDGETMLYDGLIPVIRELIREGHYVQIVTNTTITKAIERLLASDIDLSHLFIKCSLQYMELKQRNMLDIYASNVKKLWESGCSVSVEVTPHDGLIPYLEELKNYTLTNFGALPHITTARNEESDDFGLLTGLSMEEYRRIWGQFASPMFDFKISNIGVSRKGFECMAGVWSLKLNLATGELQQCPYHKAIDYIYENIDLPVRTEKVGTGCQLPYCYNCHAYLTWGTIKQVQAPTYLEMRDRETDTGRHWIKDEMRTVLSQKLYLNNDQEQKET